MARVTIQDALDYCLVNPDGLSVDELLAKFPDYIEELQPLLALSASIATFEPPPVPSDRRAAMKQRLMDAASAATASVAIPPRPIIQTPAPRPWRESLAALVRRPALAGALGAVAVIALLWWSTASSLPDSPLYGVKLGSESVLRNFQGGTSAQIDDYLGSADARLRDITEMQRRNKLAQAGPAIEDYRSSIANSASLWEQTTGEERTELAKKIYVTSVRGVVDLGAIAPDLPNIAEPVRADINQTIATLEDVRAATEGTLTSANVDVNALLLDAGIEPSSVPTSLSRTAIGTATLTVPVIARATQTAVATPPLWWLKLRKAPLALPPE